MYYPVKNKAKITFSVLASAALAYLLHKQRDAVGITTFSDTIEYQSPVKSTKTHLHKLFLELQKLLDQSQTSKKTAVADVLHQIANKIHKRSLVIIFSDMFDNKEEIKDIISALHHLKHNNHEVLLFHVTDPRTEYEFDFEERPYVFVDLETRQKVKVQPSEVKEFYKKEIKKYYYDLKLKCGQFKIDFIEADVNEDFDKILSSYLIKHVARLFSPGVPQVLLHNPDPVRNNLQDKQLRIGVLHGNQYILYISLKQCSRIHQRRVPAYPWNLQPFHLLILPVLT
jgi:uncharacterized protein (DUF58 family)